MLQKLKSGIIISFAVSSLLLAMHAFAADDGTLAEASKLVRARNFAAAYKLLEPLEATRAGELDFDYLFGVAGVESGNATRGVFALERVLAIDPNHKDARAEIAKAHFMLGETETSKAEFKNVLQENPDADTKKVIEGLLTSIAKLEGATTTYAGYLDFGLGWDSNVSSAPNIASVQIAAGVPNFGGLIVPLGKSSREQSDHFINFGGGVSFRHPFNTELALFGSVSAANRINGDKHDFDTKSLDLSTGLDYRPSGENSFTFAMQDGHFSLNEEGFRHAYGGSLQWLHNIDAKNQGGLYAQFSRLHYMSNSIRDADRGVLGANFGHVFDGDLKPVFFASVYGGREEARKSIVNFLSQDIVGVRTGGQLSFNSQLQGFASLAYELRNYDEKDPAFLTKRRDNQYDASIGLRYSPMHDLTIKPQFSYTKNDSNTPIDAFDRKVISISVRKDFNW